MVHFKVSSQKNFENKFSNEHFDNFFKKHKSYDSYEEKFIEAPGMKKSFGSFQSFFQKSIFH